MMGRLASNMVQMFPP